MSPMNIVSSTPFPSRFREDGFTVVETLVTLFVAVLFLVSINLVFTTIGRATASARSRNDAGNLAYNNLRKYAYNGASTSWFSCTTTSDLQQSASATGQVVDSGSVSSAQTTLPQPVTYKIVAIAPYGCTGVSPKPPLLIRSSITYGPDNLTIMQASYTENTL